MTKKKTEEQNTKLIYTGTGFIHGIPARDLEPDEVEKFGGLEYLLSTGLYKVEESE